jgi:hypothetical protein
MAEDQVSERETRGWALMRAELEAVFPVMTTITWAGFSRPSRESWTGRPPAGTGTRAASVPADGARGGASCAGRPGGHSAR